MATRVLITTPPGNRVVVNAQRQKVIRSVGLAPSGTQIEASTQLRDLTDVNATSIDNNDTLVYDSSTDKFIVKVLPDINGGDF